MGTAEPMKVLSVSPSVAGGGAEKVALMLHERYLARNIESWLAVGSRNAEASGTLQVPRDAGRSAWARALLGPAWRLEERGARGSGPARLASRALRVAAEPARWMRVARGHEDFDFPWTPGLLDLPPAPPDVLHLHNLHGGYFDIRALPELTRRVPTVLTLHDTWLLTGHCAHPLGCEGWRRGCGSCPDLDRYVPVRRDATAANFRVKHHAVGASRVRIAAPSRWLLSMAEESGLFAGEREGRVVPNGVDAQAFSPGSRTASREALGLPPDRAVLLVAARGVRDNPFKGFDTFVEALGRLPGDLASGVLAVALGYDGPPPAAGVEFRGVPFVTEPAAVAGYYRAADVFVHPSLADSFPLAPIEAMACGTPVLVSDAGGLPEIVTDGESGLMFPAGDAAGLAAALEALLGDGALRDRLGESGLARVRDRFTLDRQVDSYLEWYEELAEEYR